MDYDYDDYTDENSPYLMTLDNEILFSSVNTLANMYYQETGNGIVSAFYSFDLPDMVATLVVNEDNEDIIPVVMQEVLLHVKDALPTTEFYEIYKGKYTLTFIDEDNKFLSFIEF